MKEINRVEPIVKPLMDWYRQNKREMPWRDTLRPYDVWLSEIMLQQTRIEAANDYFVRFTSELPDVQSLALVEDEKLMKLWQGLGYYNRARNLKKAAQIIMKQYNGELPSDYETLKSLPGIGPYTAGAISSIAYGKKAPAVDGNVLRVIMRVFAKDDDVMKDKTRREVAEQIRKALPDEAPGDFNQGIMELGETICLPKGEPLCDLCPLNDLCEAKRLGKQQEYPVRIIKKGRRVQELTILLLLYKDKCFIKKRENKGLLADMWEYPSLEGNLHLSQIQKKLAELHIDSNKLKSETEYRHIFSHIEWHLHVVSMSVKSKKQVEQVFTDGIWCNQAEIEEIYSLPTAFSEVTKVYMERVNN